MNLSEEQIRYLIEKHATDQLTNAEQNLLDEWYNSFDQAPIPDEVLGGSLISDSESDHLLKKIHTNINVPAQKNGNSWWLRIAASILIAGLTAILGFYIYKTTTLTGKASVTFTTVTVEPGQMKSVALADGSKIWLNSGSKLKYPTVFNASEREVELLEGEAFFDVKHDDKKPFIVHSKGLVTQVLGTSFNVKAYSYQSSIQVSVATGKVGVLYNKKLLEFLIPDQQINFDLNKHSSTKVSTKSSVAKAWMNGEIMMDQINFTGLQAVLQNTYGYKLQTTNSNTVKLHFTATVKRNDRITDVMDMLSNINNTTYSINNKTKTITMY
ncbi:FecR family protein [Mucilaginibacter sp. JRF]|uniref:FecR domain-containing protein n=1 Tax=Mucilaginibacter sp. JRF TaxID=2780088 RepID=UPI00187EE685|nr:FecR family protein [Mucilaginibacter sp. JRF]